MKEYDYWIGFVIFTLLMAAMAFLQFRTESFIAGCFAMNFLLHAVSDKKEIPNGKKCKDT